MHKHDYYVNVLKQRLESEYDQVLTHIPLYATKRNKTRLVGEIDVLAKKGDEIFIFEVKCSYRPTKARMQLKKISKNMKKRVAGSYFYCGYANSIVPILF